MLEEDREAIRQMKADFERIAEQTDSGADAPFDCSLWMRHYNTVYVAATRDASKASECPGYEAKELLYMDFQEMLTRYLLKHKDLSAPSEVALMERILQVWEHYKKLMKWNMLAFAYISRHYVVNHSKPSLNQVALNLFLEQIFKKHASVVSRVTQELLFRERAGEEIKRECVVSAVDLFSSMSIECTQSIYMEEFLRPYTTRTREDYDRFVVQWSLNSSASEFLAHIHESLKEERERCARYFPPEDAPLIMSCVENSLVDSPVTRATLIESDDGFLSALRQNDEHQVQQYYEFFSRRPAGLQQLGTVIGRAIEEEGAALSVAYEGSESSVDVMKYVESMMQLHENYQQRLSSTFQLEFALSKTIREGLESAYSNGIKVTGRGGAQPRVVLFSEWLAHYVHLVLQQNTSSLGSQIERIVTTLPYVPERDSFFSSSREFMAERILLPSQKFNEANEQQLIQLIQQRCGPASTAYLEGMLYDLNESNEFGAMKVLRNKNKEPPFTVMLLAAKKGIWPASLSKVSTWVIPGFIEEVLKHVGESYLEGTSGRVLAWSLDSSSAEVLGHFSTGTQLFSVTALQALLLLAFNESEIIVVRDLMEKFKAPMDEVRGAIMPLIRGHVLLSRLPESGLQPDDAVTFNKRYATRSETVCLAPAPMRTRAGPSESTTKRVEEDRKPAVDACLVQLMKEHGSLSHSELASRCEERLSGQFSIDSKLVKHRIEELIRKDYIQRDTKLSGMYRYVA